MSACFDGELSASTTSVPGGSLTISEAEALRGLAHLAPYLSSTAKIRAYSDQVLVPENFSGALLHIEPDPMDLGDDFQINLRCGRRQPR